MAQTESVDRDAFDVVDIAQGLRALANTVVMFPDDRPGLKYPDSPLTVTVIADSVESVAAWAEHLREHVEVTDLADRQRVTAVRHFCGAVRFEVVHVGTPERTLMRPADVTESFECVEVA